MSEYNNHLPVSYTILSSLPPSHSPHTTPLCFALLSHLAAAFLLSLSFALVLSVCMCVCVGLTLAEVYAQDKSETNAKVKALCCAGHAYNCCRRSERYPVISVHQKCPTATTRTERESKSTSETTATTIHCQCVCVQDKDKHSQEGWFLTFERATSLLCQSLTHTHIHNHRQSGHLCLCVNRSYFCCCFSCFNFLAFYALSPFLLSSAACTLFNQSKLAS